MRSVFAGAVLLGGLLGPFGKIAGQSDVAFPPDVYARRRAELSAKLGDATVVIAGAYGINADELGRMLDAAGVPNAPLLSVDQVAHHPQTEAVGMLAPAIAGGPRLVGIPISFGGQRQRALGSAPALGEQNAQVGHGTKKL